MRAKEFTNIHIQEGDNFDIEIGNNFCLSTYVTEVTNDSIVLEADELAVKLLIENGLIVEDAAAVGKIAGKGQKNDPRYSTSLTVDVKPDTMKKAIKSYFPTNPPKTQQYHVTENSNNPVATDSTSPINGHTTDLDEAEYQGRKVPLGKPMRGDVKKFKVYVKNPQGNVVKVNFGDPDMKIKKSNPARRKSFRARHRCATPGPRHKARYWSCRKW
jgi:hypothetical protein